MTKSINLTKSEKKIFLMMEIWKKKKKNLSVIFMLNFLKIVKIKIFN